MGQNFLKMVISRDLVLKSVQEMPEKFSIDELLDKLLLLQKLEEGLEQLKNGNVMTLEEAKKRHEKWLR